VIDIDAKAKGDLIVMLSHSAQAARSPLKVSAQLFENRSGRFWRHP